jgi:hypothetical protein
MKKGYILKINIVDVSPPVWRRFEIPSNMTLGELHSVIQEVMGWFDYHLHSFEVAGKQYGDKETDEFDDYIDENSVTVAEVIGEGTKRFKYIYDFGDHWVHSVIVEDESESKVTKPRVLKGKRACPPEDCGGPWGYADFVDAISDPKHERHEELLEWVGEDFDPEYFDIDEINEILSEAKKIVRDNS